MSSKSPSLRIPIELSRPAGPASPMPVTLGVPIPRSALVGSTTVCLLDPEEQEIPVQQEVLARWPDGSIKWLLIDFVHNGPSSGKKSLWTLRIDPEESEKRFAAETPCTFKIDARGEQLKIDTGVAEFLVSTDILRPLLQVYRNGEALLAKSGSSVLLENVPRPVTPALSSNPLSKKVADWLYTDEQDRCVGQLVPLIRNVRLEARGPVRTTLRLEGFFASSPDTENAGEASALRFVCRLCFWAGTALLRVRFTLHNPRRARHEGGLWDLGDPGSRHFEELSLNLHLSTSTPDIHWRCEAKQQARQTRLPQLHLYQDSSGGENWQSRNHVNHAGRVPLSFRGYRLRSGELEERGKRATPLLSLRTPSTSLAVGIPEFWQQFPKALEVLGSRVRIAFFPREFDDTFELQGGEQKTHRVWFNFDEVGCGVTNWFDWIFESPAVSLTPAWAFRAGILPGFDLPASQGADPLATLLAGMLEGKENLFQRREVVDEYGWRHYGETWADHEGAYYKGAPPVLSHYNNQYDFLFGLLLNFLRTADARWLHLAQPLARHVMDIDIYRTSQDKAPYNGGLFWHTDHYLDAGTCTHRTFTRSNAVGKRGYGGGPASQHNATTGLLYYYYLTGEPVARESLLGLANWVIAMDDGELNALALIEESPTGWASATFDFHGPGRGAAYSINALLDAWMLTNRGSYLEKAESLIRRCVHPNDDVAALGLEDIELRWSYTVFLSILVRYLGLKADSGAMDEAYAYAQACLVRYACWMLEHERPYFDRRDELEFPTETWAGHELRKANVLRSAAGHVDEPLRGQFFSRGTELADRAWSDLMSFESRGVVRSMAIVMTEGPRDLYFRRCGVSVAPRPQGSFAFGEPEPFVPQRARARAKLTRVAGLIWAVRKVLSPREWLRLYGLGMSLKP